MFLGLVLALLTAAAPGHAALSASLGERVGLRPGQDLVVRGEDLSVRFVSVLEDSRCPKGEQCLVAGRARIALDVAKAGEKPVRVELATAEPPAGADCAGYAITLFALAPYPVTGRPIATADYVATVAVARGGAELETARRISLLPIARHPRTHRLPLFLAARRTEGETVAAPVASPWLVFRRPPFSVLNPAFEFP